ncbi:hypothetical protein HAX54_005465 [Datura stramonium]|uniref:Uncharacterized protein n=1 Tax=Datura stramonium TaxID=4076 RepID=A0ABS8TB75_DATST|nr:hypothetical protein [Datura stramonium]
METSPTSLSSNKGSVSGPSSYSPTAVDFSTLLVDIRGQYTSKDTAPTPSSPTYSDPTGSDSTPADNGKYPTVVSLSDFGSTDDFVPLADLKKGAHKTLWFRSSQATTSNIPCVAGHASCTRAHRIMVEGPSAKPKSSPVNQPKLRVKAFYERKLLKGNMVFPSSCSCLTALWSKIDVRVGLNCSPIRMLMLLRLKLLISLISFLFQKGCITSKVGGVLVVFDPHKLGSLLGIPRKGFTSCEKNKWSGLPPPLKPLEIVCKFFGNPSRTSDSKVFKKSMSPYHRFLFAFVIKNLLPGQEYRDVKQNRAIPYWFLLTKVFGKLGVCFTSLEYYSVYDALDYFETRGSHPENGKGGSPTVAGTSSPADDGEMRKLHQEIDRFLEENKQLKAQLVKNEETVVAHHNNLISLTRSLSPLTVSSPSIAAQSPLVSPDV